MSRELPCPRCGQYDGEELFECKDCGEFCDGEGCADGANWYSANCPECDKPSPKIDNLVQPDDDDENKDDEESGGDESEEPSNSDD